MLKIVKARETKKKSKTYLQIIFFCLMTWSHFSFCYLGNMLKDRLSKRSGWQFRARKVIGTFEKRAPGMQRCPTISEDVLKSSSKQSPVPSLLKSNV